MVNVKTKKECEQIIRQLDSLLERREDNRLIFIKNEVENIIECDNQEEINDICEIILRHLEIPMRRMDDWKLDVVKHKIISLCEKE